MTPCDHDLSAVAALIDGELDAVHAAEAEARIATCPACAEESERLLGLRAALRGEGVRVAAPERLRLRLARSLSSAAAAAPPPGGAVVPLIPRRARPLAWMGGGAGLAVAASAAMLAVVMLGREDRALTGELVADHVRSLQVAHLVDVPTSDQHVVKPWFNGKLDFAPPVVELKDQGFPLVGGRLDFADHRTVAAIVYRRGRHLINLFVWPDRGAGGPGVVHAGEGYTLRHWRSGGLTFWAVSDVNPNDLALFEQNVKAQTGT
jgi:anti-sigma factor RsiW